MRKYSCLLVLLFIGLASVLRADEIEGIKKALRTKNFSQFKTLTDSLAKFSSEFDVEWEYLRDITDRHQEGVWFLKKRNDDNKQLLIPKPVKYKISVLRIENKIVDYIIGYTMYSSSFLGSEDLYLNSETFRDTIEYTKLNLAYIQLFKCEINESDLYRTNIIYGDSCKYITSSLQASAQIDRYVKNNQKDSLIMWLQSPNAEKQLYALAGLSRLNKRKTELTRDELMMIAFVKRKKGTLLCCEKISIGQQEISYTAKQFKF